jgi:putative FmdB family regulatory protein
MPTYEYACRNGHRFDRFQKMSDPPEAQCPECGEPGERQISAGAGFLFKGEGFYITDYRSPDYKAKDRADSGKGEAGTTDTKAKKADGSKSSGSSAGGSDGAAGPSGTGGA